MPEPQLEDLSAYLDHELTGTARQEIEAHLQSCETCRRRLEALSQTVNAIHELPVQAPPRPFTIPAQREQPRRVGSVFGWVGGATAAALLVVIVGVSLSHLPRGTAAPASAALSVSNKNSGSLYGAAAPVPNADQAFRSIEEGFTHRAERVTDPRNPASGIQLATDSATYALYDTMRVEVILDGAPNSTTASVLAGLQLSLQRTGVGTKLPASVMVAQRVTGSNIVPPVFVGTYPISSLSLPGGPGSYTLVASWTIPGSSKSPTILVAMLPIEITS